MISLAEFMWACAFALGMFYDVVFHAIHELKSDERRRNIQRIQGLCKGATAHAEN